MKRVGNWNRAGNFGIRYVEEMMQGRGLGREQGCYPDGCRQRSDRSAALRAVPKPKTPPKRMHMRWQNHVGWTRGLVDANGGSFPSTPTGFHSHPLKTPLKHRARIYHTHQKRGTPVLKFQLITVDFQPRASLHVFFFFSFQLRDGMKIWFSGGSNEVTETFLSNASNNYFFVAFCFSLFFRLVYETIQVSLSFWYLEKIWVSLEVEPSALATGSRGP